MRDSLPADRGRTRKGRSGHELRELREIYLAFLEVLAVDSSDELDTVKLRRCLQQLLGICRDLRQLLALIESR